MRIVLNAGAAIVTGTLWVAKKAVPRKFVRAVPLKKWRGPVRSLQNISKQSKWSG
jgi:hypothetical protein